MSREICDKCFSTGKVHVNRGDQPHIWEDMYDCHNPECKVYIQNRAAEARRKNVAAENAKNGVDASALRAARVNRAENKYMNQMDAARHLGIGTAKYSSYENGHEVMPPELYALAMEVFRRMEARSR